MTFLIDGMADMAYIWPLSSHWPQEDKNHDQEIIDTMLVEETEKRKVDGPVEGSRKRRRTKMNMKVLWMRLRMMMRQKRNLM